MLQTALHAELQKAHRRHDLAVVLGIALILLLWANSADPRRADELATGYTSLLYSLPMMNAVVLPIGMAALASRIWDAETKGESCKLLFTLQSRGSLFWGKAALGMAENLLLCAVECACVVLLGRLKGFTEVLQPTQLFWFFATTFMVNAMLYFFLFYLSLRIANQIAALAVGFCGALVGLFASYMPRGFACFVPFGYYVQLGTVGMDWDSASRLTSFYPLPTPWWLLGVTAALTVLCITLCRRHIEKKEV